jgi:hypothetical protein
LVRLSIHPASLKKPVRIFLSHLSYTFHLPTTFFHIFLHHIQKKLKGHHFGLLIFLKILFLTLRVHPLESEWPLVEEVALEVEEKVVKDHLHPHPP